jgi:hypothetical protein
MATENVKAMWALLLSVTVVTAIVPGAAAGQFKKPVYYKLNGDPYQIIATDFTGDGNLDLAEAEFYPGVVGVLLGKGNGTFHAAHYFSAPGAIALAAGDFNGDGKLDLAVVEYGGTGHSQLGIFLGDGKGNFRNSATYTLGIKSQGIAVADFDGDGHADVAVTNGQGYGKNGKTGSVSVFLSKGDGTFKAPVIYKLSGFPVGVAAGDFNGDHHPDLVVTQASAFTVAILMNDGHGRFKHTETYQAGGAPIAVAIADLDHNGAADLTVCEAAGVAVLLGNGDGTFGAATFYSTSGLGSGFPIASASADFNRDGSLDIALAISSGEGGIAMLYGNGNGTFQNPISVVQPKGDPAGMATGDFNKDGAPDLAVSAAGYNNVVILINAY